MKKVIITTSLLALFVGSAFAELSYPIQVDNFTIIKENVNGEIIAQDNLNLVVSPNAGYTGSIAEPLVYIQADNANITKFTANGITTTATFAEGYKWLSLTGILNLESVKESYTLNNASFTNNSASTTNTTTGTYGSVLRTGKVSGVVQNSIFKGNYGYSNNQVQGTLSIGVTKKILIDNVTFDSNTIESTNSQGGAIASFGSKEVNINNSSFISNTASSQSQYAYGGAVYLRGAAWGGYADGVANISNTTFDKNTAISYSASQGGAVYIKSELNGSGAANGKISAIITDTAFTNNASIVEDKMYQSVSGGGAIYSYDSVVNFVATKDITNVGNYASVEGVKRDDRGGFIYLKSNALTATGNFDISENATMTIGDGTAGFDSIASENNKAIINKTGAGSLVVNSSMEYFTGTLNVTAGAMEANKGLGATAINIANGATLNVGLTSTSLTSATVVNDGILGLKRGTLSDGDSLTISSYSGEGTVNAFGGSFANGVFTAGKSAVFTSNSITVGNAENDVQTVSYTTTNNNKLILDFDVSGKETMTVNSITEVVAFDVENIRGEFITGFSIDATYNGDLSVVLSAYVGEIEDASKLLAWHKENGSDVWTQLDAKVEYDASTGLASIFVEGFSSYAFSQVPEPAEWAVIFGAVALMFVVYRRRK